MHDEGESVPDSSLTPGESVQFTAVARDAGGDVLSGQAVTWATADSSVATVIGRRPAGLAGPEPRARHHEPRSDSSGELYLLTEAGDVLKIVQR